MLTKLLEIIKKKKVISFSDLSRIMDLEKGTIKQMIKQLISMGYLEEETINQEFDCQNDIPSKCQKCPKIGCKSNLMQKRIKLKTTTN
jgi:hypothetical protein